MDAATRRRVERAFRVAVLVLTVVGISLPAAFVQAQDVTIMVNYILLGLSHLLQWLLNFLGQFTLLLMDAIIGVAKYNDFAKAKPVEIGWPLVRDVVNMFFIVVLLVTAFSTIIRYDKFNYREILPKLLLMAVLVNFSKTLIGLLIDLSQVIMLTFVNGFQAAATGNLVDLLKLDNVMSLARGTGTAAETVRDARNQLSSDLQESLLVKLVMAEMLGLFFLGTTCVTLLIMLVYLVVRVVGLWVALIMSPAAFFASTLKGTPLSKGVGYLTDKFWPRLGALLSGGPIIAFFLWLTLATVQSGSIALEQSAERGAETAEAISYFASAVGNTEEVATFLVGILLLLMGVEAAVSISGEVSSSLGKVAKGIQGTGMRLTRLASYGGVLGGTGLAFRGLRAGGGAAAGAAGGLIERKFDLASRAGKVLQTVGGKVGSVSMQKQGGEWRGFRDEQRKKMSEKLKKKTLNMSEAETIAAYEKASKDSNTDVKAAATHDLAKFFASKSGTKELKRQYEEEGKKKVSQGLLEESEVKAYADAQARERKNKQFAEFKALAKETGDKAMNDEVDAEVEKYPDRLVNDPAAFKEQMRKVADKGPKEMAKLIHQDAYQNSGVSDWVFSNTDILNEDGSWNEQSETWKALVKNPSGRSRLLDQRRRDLLQDAGEGRSVKQLASEGHGASFYSQDGANWKRVPRGTISRAASGAVAAPRGRAQVRNEGEVTAAAGRVQRMRAEHAASPALQTPAREAQMRGMQYEGMRAGARVSEVYDVNNRGAFANATERTNFRQNVQQFTQEAAADPGRYRSLDVSELQSRPNEAREDRSVFTAAASMDSMKRAWDQAEAADDSGTVDQISAAVGVVHQEGSRIQDKLQAYSTDHPEQPLNLEAIENAALADDAQALWQAVSPMGDNGLTMDEAKAFAKKRQIDRDPVLRTFRHDASDRTAQAMRTQARAEEPARQAEVQARREAQARAEGERQAGAQLDRELGRTPGMEPRGGAAAGPRPPRRPPPAPGPVRFTNPSPPIPPTTPPRRPPPGGAA
jgi:hypothetical protein